MREVFRRCIRYVGRVWTSFWFLPLVMSLAGGLAGYVAISVDETVWARQLADNKLVLAITVDGARSVISTVAGGIITMASLVFSLTFVALTLMSQQLGPRLIQIFVRDRFAQFTFGSFTGSFLFCLFVLAVTGTGKKGEFVPVFSTLLVIVVAITSFCMMILYINHVANSIQADTLIARLGRQLGDAIDKLLVQPASGRRDLDSEDKSSDGIKQLKEDLEGSELAVEAKTTGYVATVDTDTLVDVLCKHDMRAATLVRPGHFVTHGLTLIKIDKDLKGDEFEALCEEVHDAFNIESTRSLTESGEFEVNALVEVALRALSPGINDSYTANACIDQLVNAISSIAAAHLKPRLVRDADGQARLLLYSQGFSHFINTAFHPIRHAARDNPLVLSRLLNACRVLLSLQGISDHDAKAVNEHLSALKETIESNVSTGEDRDHLLERLGSISDAKNVK